MMDYLDAALTYGGFTKLDEAYLTQLLQGLTHDQKLAIITPPPSVINAYFAEHYQRTSPEAALDYLFDLSQAFDLFQTAPDFREQKPFVRLNLSGRSFGLCFENAQGLVRVFPEDGLAVSEQVFFELAELFPHLVCYSKGGKIYLRQQAFDETAPKDITPSDLMLTKVEQLGHGTTKLSGYSREELLEAVQVFEGERLFAVSDCQSFIYVLES